MSTFEFPLARCLVAHRRRCGDLFRVAANMDCACCVAGCRDRFAACLFLYVCSLFSGDRVPLRGLVIDCGVDVVDKLLCFFPCWLCQDHDGDGDADDGDYRAHRRSPPVFDRAWMPDDVCSPFSIALVFFPAFVEA